MENNKYIDDSIINIAFGDKPEEQETETPQEENDTAKEAEKINESKDSAIVIMNLVQKCLSELDLSQEEMDRIFSSSNIQSDKALSLIYELNCIAAGNGDKQKKKIVEMQLENEYKRTNYVKHEPEDDDPQENAHYSELKEAISELITVYFANMEQRKELLEQANEAIYE